MRVAWVCLYGVCMHVWVCGCVGVLSCYMQFFEYVYKELIRSMLQPFLGKCLPCMVELFHDKSPKGDMSSGGTERDKLYMTSIIINQMEAICQLNLWE